MLILPRTTHKWGQYVLPALRDLLAHQGMAALDKLLCGVVHKAEKGT